MCTIVKHLSGQRSPKSHITYLEIKLKVKRQYLLKFRINIQLSSDCEAKHARFMYFQFVKTLEINNSSFQSGGVAADSNSVVSAVAGVVSVARN